jgi:putative flippase GtrA
VSPSFPLPSARRGVLLGRIVGFGGISALGLGLDCGLFILLVAAGAPPLLANLASAGTAVTFVFFASVRRVFRFRGGAVWARYLAYALWQAVAVTAASVAIGALAAHGGLPPLACKLALLPLTFAANYLVMALLTRPGAQP